MRGTRAAPEDVGMEALWRDLKDLVALELNEAALEALEWRDYGKGVELARLKRGENASLVLYRVADGAPRDAFARHRHPGGEAYLVPFSGKVVLIPGYRGLCKLMRLGGVKEDDFYEAVLDTTRARFPWLLVNLITVIIASITIGFFYQTIQQIVALAILMPIVA